MKWCGLMHHLRWNGIIPDCNDWMSRQGHELSTKQLHITLGSMHPPQCELHLASSICLSYQGQRLNIISHPTELPITVTPMSDWIVYSNDGMYLYSYFTVIILFARNDHLCVVEQLVNLLFPPKTYMSCMVMCWAIVAIFSTCALLHTRTPNVDNRYTKAAEMGDGMVGILRWLSNGWRVYTARKHTFSPLHAVPVNS